MEIGADPVMLRKSDVRKRLKALPEIIRNFDLESQVQLVEEGACGEDKGACVNEFNHFNGSPRGASVAEIVEEAEGQTLKIDEVDLNHAIWKYKNPEEVSTPYGDLSEEFSKGMSFCIYVGIFGHELLHTAGMSHAEDYGRPDDPVYALGLQLNYSCLDPYYEEYEQLQEEAGL